MNIIVALLFSFAGHSWGCSKREEFTKHKRDHVFDSFFSHESKNFSDPLQQTRDPLYNWEQAIVAFPAEISGVNGSVLEEQIPFLIFGPFNKEMSPGAICPPGNFKFGRAFEQMEVSQGPPRRMSNYRAAYTQDGFLICGLDGGYNNIPHECCYWSMHGEDDNECLLLDQGALPSLIPPTRFQGLEMIIATDELRPDFQHIFYYYISDNSDTYVLRGELKTEDGILHWQILTKPHWVIGPWINTKACPVVIKDKLILLGGNDINNQNLVYDPLRNESWYKTNTFFGQNFETLSCTVEKKLPRVVVLVKEKNTGKLALKVAEVGWHNAGDGEMLHLKDSPLNNQMDAIDNRLIDGIMFCLDGNIGTDEAHMSNTVVVGFCKNGTDQIPCAYDVYRFGASDGPDKDGEIRGITAADPWRPLNEYVPKTINGMAIKDSVNFDKKGTRYAMVKTTYFEAACQPYRVMPKPYGAPDFY